MKAPVPVPQDQLGWLREIAAAYCEAQEAIPFGRLIGEPIAEGDLFHLAPRVALKVRGLRASPRNLKKATEAALASYVANKERQPEVLADPRLAFAFCYLAGHYGLGLVEAGDVDQLMEFVEERRSDLRALTGGARCPARFLQAVLAAVAVSLVWPWARSESPTRSFSTHGAGPGAQSAA